MPYFEEIDNGYLSEAVKRLTQMIEVATPDPTQVLSYIDPKVDPPFWWLYPGVTTLQDLAYEIEKQPYEVIGRYVIGFNTEGYDGNTANRIWVIMPTVLNFINSHKRLMFPDRNGNEMYQDSVPFLDSDSVRARQVSGFGVFPQSTHIGIEIGISLPFTVQIENQY